MIDSYYVQVNKTKRDIPLGSKNSNINTNSWRLSKYTYSNSVHMDSAG